MMHDDSEQQMAKLKAIKAELQRRKHHRTTAVGAWLRKVVLLPIPCRSGELDSVAHLSTSRLLVVAERPVRRSQRAQVRWARLSPVLNRWVPQPRVLHRYPDARFAASHPR
jgi:hypothetical protein